MILTLQPWKEIAMSSIFGFATQHNLAATRTLLNAMEQALPNYQPVTQDRWEMQEGYAGLEAIQPARIGDSGLLAQDPAHGLACVFDGEIYADTDAQHQSPIVPNAAKLMLQHYQKCGPQELSQFSGSFNVAWWDNKKRRLVLANDRLGHRLMFYTLQDGVLLFSSSVARILDSNLFSPCMDSVALAELLTYNHTLGKRTLFQDVYILPPGSVLIYAEGQLHIHQYWSWNQIEPHGVYDKRRLDELQHVFKSSVTRAIRQDLTCSIALTGGLDSRCIMAAAAQQGLSYISHTGGQPDTTDVILAKKVAAEVGVPHSFGRLDPYQTAEWLYGMVQLQGGFLATLNSHPCKMLNDPPTYDAQVEGTAGEIAKATWLGAQDLETDNSKQSMDCVAAGQILGRYAKISTARRLDPEYLWRTEFSYLGHSALQSLDDFVASYQLQDTPLTITDYFGLYEHTRKMLNKATLLVRPGIEAYFPYLDHQWLEAILAVPVSERINNRIQIDLIRRFYPSLLAIPYEKTLMPLSASKKRIWLTKKYRAVRRRLRKLFPLLPPVPDRVPNINHWQWTRGAMRSVLMDLLYNPTAAFRTFISWEKVKPLLDQHFSGQEQWKDLVPGLAVFEIAHRLWVSRDRIPSHQSVTLTPSGTNQKER
jgi:asparagine synthetase B (glutamine-hydrolysing)